MVFWSYVLPFGWVPKKKKKGAATGGDMSEPNSARIPHGEKEQPVIVVKPGAALKKLGAKTGALQQL